MRTKSKKPKKQRKYEKNVPLHESHKLMSAHLSRELREQKGFRSLPLRPKDEVVVVRGKHKGAKGKVTYVHPTEGYVTVEKVTFKKTDDSEIPVKLHPSNLIITKIGKSKDKKRLALINRRIKDEEEFLTDEDLIDEDEDIIDMDQDELEEESDSEEEFELTEESEEETTGEVASSDDSEEKDEEVDEE